MKNQIKYYFKKFIRQGITFKQILRDLQESQYFSAEQLEEMQNQKLKDIIEHCYKNVPYYREIFDKLNLKPEDIKTKKDLEKLPLLDKHIVIKNYGKLIAKNKNKFFCNIGQTSGTTGTPLNLRRDYHSINFENAIVNRFYSNVADLKSKKITLRGEIIVPIKRQKPPFWKYNQANNELLMSSYHLSNKTAKIFIDKIKHFNPQIIYAYPSAIYLLAQHFDNLQEKIKIDAIFTSSEKLETEKREFIEKVFNCKIYDWYGQAERVAAISQCEGGAYHIIEDYSIVETVETENGLELVGTNLENYIMPLLRYRTGDIVELEESGCPCGRHFRKISKIQGRKADYITTENGLKFVAFNHIPRGVDNLIELQFVQEKIGELTINITTNGRFREEDRQKLIKNTLEHTDLNMNVIINEMDEIPRGANGKFESVVNKLYLPKSNPQKKFYIILEDDWELRGNGLGNVVELQYLPSLFLMNICEKLDIKMTFMVDVAQQLCFDKYQNYPEIKLQKDLWDNAVRMMKRRGFDVQLHLHPQWLDAKYDNRFFYLNENWNIGTYEDSVRKDLIDKSVKYLEELIKPIDSEYDVISFKPGSWGIQPSEGVLNDLSSNGIKLVVGIKKDLYFPYLNIDYRNIEEDKFPYYPDYKDITKIAAEKNNMIVLPLMSYSPDIIMILKLLLHKIKKKLMLKLSSKKSKKKRIPLEIKNLNPIRKIKINGLLNPYTTHIKVGNQPFSYLKKSFDETIKKLDKHNQNFIPILVESHTKDYLKNYTDIEKFLEYIAQEYKDKVEFITLTEFLKKVENNEFEIKYKG